VTISDILGSVRAVTDNNGALKECYDYLPFGRMLTSSDNGRSSAGCYPSAPAVSVNSRVSQKFTGQPHDNATGLDYFGARFYSAPLGRFTSPDPVLITSGRLRQPHTLNLYTYANNNPLRFIDPTGLEAMDVPFISNPFADASSPLRNIQSFDDLSNLINMYGWGATETLNLMQGLPNIGGISASTFGLWYYDMNLAMLWMENAARHQALIEAQDAARTNPAFQPGDNTYCNQATASIAAEKYAPMGPLVNSAGTPFLANQQALNLASSSEYRLVSRNEAQMYANWGDLVIAAYNNPGGSGHTATVRPQGAGDSPPANGRGPLINDIGRKNTVHNENLAFPKGATVYYYTPHYTPRR
jgi:RHS repeat-associated protein